MADHHQPISPTPSAAGSPASSSSSNKTLIFPPLIDSPTSTVYGDQLLYSTRSPDRWSIESICRPKKTAEELFDEIVANVPPTYQPTHKPAFEAVHYNPDEPPKKWRRMFIRAKENEMKKRLEGSGGLTAKEVDEWARQASYYPGAVGSRYDRMTALEVSSPMTPPRLSFTSSEDEQSPRYLFKDLPAELPKRRKVPGTNLVPFFKSGPVDRDIVPDKVIGAFRLEVPMESDSSSSSSSDSNPSPPAEPISPKKNLTSQPSLGYQLFHPIILLVPKQMRQENQGSLNQFSRQFNIDIVDGEFDPDMVTHVIFDEEPGDFKLNHILAIGYHKRLVRLNWIFESLKLGNLQDPEMFEVPSSKIVRTMGGRLFAGYAFLFVPPFDKIKCDLLSVMVLFNGGRIVWLPEHAELYKDMIVVCIVGEELCKDEEKKKQLREELAEWKCVKVNYHWILEALDEYSLPTMIGYLFDSSVEDARIAGVPETILYEPVSSGIESELLSSKETISTRPSSGYRPVHIMVVLLSEHLLQNYQSSLEKLCQYCNIRFVDGKFNRQITHVIFEEEPMKGDFNVLHVQAIGYHACLVRLDWIEESLKVGKLLDPEMFEVPASRIPRTTGARLFDGFVFLLAKPFAKIKTSELWPMLVFNGGRTIFHPADFANHSNSIRICIVGKLAFYGKPENRQRLKHCLHSRKCVTVHYHWIFEALTNYRLPSMIGYLFDSTVEDARHAGVPQQLLLQ